jgi:hypothetical protein
MKNYKLIMMSLLLLVIGFSIGVFDNLKAKNKETYIQISELKESISSIKSQLQDIQDNYVSYDDLQPVLDELYDLDQRLIPVEDDVKYYREIWREYFGMEVE